jgi:O-antigen/teichoic acid export membrane protein
VIYLPVFALAPLVLPRVLGPDWPLAAPIAQAMTPFMIVAFVASPCSRLLTAVNKPQLKVWSDMLRLVGTPLLIHGCSTRGVPFPDTMWYLSWFLAVAYLLYFGMTYFAVLPDDAP